MPYHLLPFYPFSILLLSNSLLLPRANVSSGLNFVTSWFFNEYISAPQTHHRGISPFKNHLKSLLLLQASMVGNNYFIRFCIAAFLLLPYIKNDFASIATLTPVQFSLALAQFQLSRKRISMIFSPFDIREENK